MVLNLKELAVLLAIATVVFWFARSFAWRFSSHRDFGRRCTAWYLITAAAFLMPSFWWFVAITTPTLVWLGRRESNPVAAFLFLVYAIPPVSERVPMVGISYLFDVNFALLLSFLLLTPAALKVSRSKNRPRRHPVITDLCLFFYCGLTSVLFVHPEIARGVLMSATATDCLRRAFTFFFSLIIPYYVISRFAVDRDKLKEAIAWYCLACSLFAAIAIFEATRHWLLYNDLINRWRSSDITLYLMRGGALRAMASSGQPLKLGLLLSVGFGLWLGVQRYISASRTRVVVMAALWAGLLAAYSRGPWIGAVIIYFVFAALQSQPISRLLRAVGIALVVGLAILISPLGTRITEVLPFLGGSIDIGDVIYRHELFERGWQIISASPWLGDPYALLKMQELRQGQGIIDLINGYIVILLSNGVVGLCLYMGFIISGLWGGLKATRVAKRVDQRLCAVGAGIVAVIVATLIMMESLGINDLLICILVGLAVGYTRVVDDAQPAKETMTAHLVSPDLSSRMKEARTA